MKKRSHLVARIGTVLEGTSQSATRWAGSSWAFSLAVLVLLVWLTTGPLFRYSDTWQLVINTGTTIVTFLMVFLIQRAQNKDALAIQLKLNEIVAALSGASNRLIDVEDLSELELRTLKAHFHELASMAKNDQDLLQSHSVEEATRRHRRKHGPIVTAALVALALQLAAGMAWAGTPGFEGRFVEVFWSPTPGTRRSLARIDLDALHHQTMVRRDPQYDTEVYMRGVWLTDVLARVAIPAAADQALLRFDNGMQIPIAFREPDVMLKLGAFVARATARDRWSPLVLGAVEAARRPPTEDDMRAVSFHGNKMVVNDAAPAGVLASTVSDLRPWQHADSLFAIELVTRSKWEQQLDAGAQNDPGKVVYLGTCRFCHAVRGVGGAMGWDFVEPYLILSSKWNRYFTRGADERWPMPARTMLSLHVRFRAGVDGNRTMPALRGMREEEVSALWSWLQAVAARPIP